MAVPTNPEAIADAAWAAGDTLKEITSPRGYMPYLLALFFLKYLSDLPKDKDKSFREPTTDADTVDELASHASGRFWMHSDSTFEAICIQRYMPGNARRIDTALNEITTLNAEKLGGIFTLIQFAHLNPDDEGPRDKVLCSLLESFAKPELNLAPALNSQPDLVAEAFDQLLHRFALFSERSEGAFHTPPELGRLLARLVSPLAKESVYDPACGSGSLLIHSMKENRGTAMTLYGQEESDTLCAIAKMNLLIHGNDHASLTHGDVVLNPGNAINTTTLQQFDVLLSNPPFSVETWSYKHAENDAYGRFIRGIPPKTRGNFALILHMIASMEPDSGRCAIVVPHGVLFRGASEAEIRKSLIQENLIDAVIGLPDKMLYSTPIPTSILILRAGKTDSSVLFIDASEDFTYGRTQNTLTNENIDAIIHLYNNRQIVSGHASIVDNKLILENDGNLNIGLYIESPQNTSAPTVSDVINERERIKALLSDLDHEISSTLKSLGH